MCEHPQKASPKRDSVEIFLNAAKYLVWYLKTVISENHQLILQKLQGAFHDGQGDKRQANQVRLFHSNDTFPLKGLKYSYEILAAQQGGNGMKWTLSPCYTD